jgi:hypothetical protein
MAAAASVIPASARAAFFTRTVPIHLRRAHHSRMRHASAHAAIDASAGYRTRYRDRKCMR